MKRKRRRIREKKRKIEHARKGKGEKRNDSQGALSKVLP